MKKSKKTLMQRGDKFINSLYIYFRENYVFQNIEMTVFRYNAFGIRNNSTNKNTFTPKNECVMLKKNNLLVENSDVYQIIVW